MRIDVGVVRFFTQIMERPIDGRLCNKTWNPTFIRVEDMPNWQDSEDSELIKFAQEGESEAFGELYQRYAQTIFRFIYANLNNRLDAEDLTEEVFFRAWRSLSKYRQKGVPFLAYLFKIARNVLIDFYRRAGRSGGIMSIEEKQITDFNPDPGETAILNIEHQEVRQTLTQLREDYRTVIVLRFLSGLSPEETGQVMGRTPGAVRILQHRALSALRSLLEI
jgi:RNA polymerase sigma-70 factor (ECF subfamily)